MRMFIRVKTTPNSPRKSIQIVEGVRDKDGKVKQKIVRHVGVAQNDDELVRLRDLAEYIKANIEDERHPRLFEPSYLAQEAIKARRAGKVGRGSVLSIDNIKNLREEQRVILGIHEIYGKIYNEIGFNEVLSNSARSLKTSEYLRHIVMARIANPKSKRRSVQFLESDFGVSLDLQSVYRMMDKLDDSASQKAQGLALQSAQGLLKEKIDVLLYDLTTLYFESFNEDDLKQNGYSKDMKFNQPQVVFALLVTQQGLPVGYEVFPGSTYEGHTLLKVLLQLKKKFRLNKIIFVADSGLCNDTTLNLLETEGYSFVVGARLKNMSNQIKDKILDHESYRFVRIDDEEWKYKDLKIKEGRRLLINYNKKRAAKDKHDRDKAITKLLKKLKKSKKNPKDLISNYGYKRYLEIQGDMTIGISNKKLVEDQKWDGLHGVVTNIKDMSIDSIFNHYKDLWQIEESFRINKHDLRIRPIFHWTPERIKAHLLLSFMAFTCVRNLEYRVALQSEKLSPERVRVALCGVQTSCLKHIHTGRRYGIPSRSSPEAKKIYQVMGEKLSDIPFEIA